LTGNQTGVLILDYLIKNTNNLANKQVFKSIVSSNLTNFICEKHNVKLVEVLTGFKYIGEKIRKLESIDNYLFGFEDSYGSLISPLCRDKDAVQAALMLVEIASFYDQQNSNLLLELNKLYKEFGYFNESTYSVTLTGNTGQRKISKIMEYFRSEQLLMIGGLKVIEKIDFLKPIEFDPADIIKFNLENNN